MFFLIFFFNTFSIEYLSIIPGLKILGSFVKSITVDSIPTLHLPPLIITWIFLLNSSNTSSAVTGLTFVDLLALGIAKGNLIRFSRDLTILCFGNLIAIVFNFAEASGLILDPFFLFKINVIGPGQNCWYSFWNFSLTTISFEASSKLK